MKSKSSIKKILKTTKLANTATTSSSAVNVAANVNSAVHLASPASAATQNGTQSQKTEDQLYIQRLKEKAAANDLKAEFELANCYETGNKIDMDIKMAFEIYQKLAKVKFNNLEQYEIGMQVHDKLGLAYYSARLGLNKDNDKALFHFTAGEKLATEKGITLPAETSFQLAVFYEFGVCRPKDLIKTIALYDSAMRQGHIKATFRLGKFYQTHLGYEYAKRAFECYEFGAKLGDIKCQLQLALCYIEGIGVPRDIAKGRNLLPNLEKSITPNENLNTLQQRKILFLLVADILEAELTGNLSKIPFVIDQLNQIINSHKAIAQNVKISKEGQTVVSINQEEENASAAAYYLAGLYRVGFGVERDIKMAYDLIKDKKSSGFGPLLYMLGLLEEQGANDNQPNLIAAKQYYRQASEYGEDQAALSWAWFTIYDSKSSKDEIAQAFDCAQIAKSYGAIGADLCIEVCYLLGLVEDPNHSINFKLIVEGVRNDSVLAEFLCDQYVKLKKISPLLEQESLELKKLRAARELHVHEFIKISAKAGQLKLDLEEANNHNQVKEKQLRSANDEIKKLKQMTLELQRADQNKKTMTTKMKEKNKGLSDEIVALKQAVKQEETRRSTIAVELNKQQALVQKLEQELAHSKVVLKDTRELLEKSQLTQNALELEKTTANAQMAMVKQKISDSAASYAKEMEKLQAELAETKQNGSKALFQKEQELAQLKDQLVSARREIAILKEENQTLLQTKQELVTVKKEKESLTGANTRLNSDLQSLSHTLENTNKNNRATLDSLEKKLLELKAKYKALESSSNATITELKSKNETLQNSSDKAFSDLKAKYEALKKLENTQADKLMQLQLEFEREKEAKKKQQEAQRSRRRLKQQSAAGFVQYPTTTAANGMVLNQYGNYVNPNPFTTAVLHPNPLPQQPTVLSTTNSQMLVFYPLK